MILNYTINSAKRNINVAMRAIYSIFAV